MIKFVSIFLTAAAILNAYNASVDKMFDPDTDYIYYSKYKASFYYVVLEKDFPSSPLSSMILDCNGRIIARVHPDFKKKADIEGTALLRDGRTINYACRKNNDIRYQVVKNAFYGLGVENYKLIPYRTVAVDPRNILIGSVVFVPQAVGMPLGNGTFHDGYFLAHDVGLNIKGRSIDFFVGLDGETDNQMKKSGKILSGDKVDVYVVRGIMERVINLKYRLRYRWRPIKQLHEMVASEFDAMMKAVNLSQKSISEKLEFYSRRSKGAPYLLFCLGEGPSSAYDADPLMDFSRFDCMTFCEHMLALSISNNYRETFKNLQKIRYKGGEINILKRNHFAVADWLPNNRWLLYNASEELGNNFCTKMTKTIDRNAFFEKLGIPRENLSKVQASQTLAVKYIPKNHLLSIADKLKGGEIVCILTYKPGIFSTHMGLIVRDSWNNLIFRHASSLEKYSQVMDIKFSELVDNLNNTESAAGILFMKVKKGF